MVGHEAALLAGADGAALRPDALLGGEDANHHCTGCSRGRAARSTMCSGLSPTVSYCHILRNLGVGMELTGAMDVALANCVSCMPATGGVFRATAVTEDERTEGMPLAFQPAR